MRCPGLDLHYTEQVQRRSFLAGGAVLALVLATGAGWWLWRQKQDRGILLSRLPAENSIILYVDVERLRRSPALLPLVRSRVDPDPDYAAFVKQTGFDYQRDLDAATVCYLPDRVFVLARGRFDEAKLRRYAVAQGGTCPSSAFSRARPCSMPASQPGRKLSFQMISSGVLALANAPEADAVTQLETTPASNAAPLAQAASGNSGAGPLLWLTAAPETLDRTLSSSFAQLPNVTLFSKALSGAQRAFLMVSDNSPDLEVSLKATCASDAQADELKRLWQGLEAFAGGMLRGTGPRNASSGWGKVLASGKISQEGNAVRAAWTVDAAILQDLSGQGSGK